MSTLSNAPSLTPSPVSTTSGNLLHRPFAGGLLSRNKKSLVLDLKRKAAREAILRLAKNADVFVHNMRTGAAARLGIDYTTIAAANPGIVYASATGYRPGTRYEGELYILLPAIFAL